MNLDKLNHVSPEAVAQSALDALDKVTDLRPEVQGPALAMTLIAYARRVGVDVGSLFTVAQNILGSKHQNTPSFQAVQLYMRHEISATN